MSGPTTGPVAHYTFRPWRGENQTSRPTWRKASRWDQEAWEREVAQGRYGMQPDRPRVFCATDWLDPEAPAEWLADLLALVYRTPNLDWLLLSKRPELWRERLYDAIESVDGMGNTAGEVLAADWLSDKAPPNVWVGTTIEDQAAADARIPHLLSIPARVRFLSCEPLLGPVGIGDRPSRQDGGSFLSPSDPSEPGIHWVIAGGESGPGARPMHPDWARSLRDQCSSAGVPFLFRQWGEWLPIYSRDNDPDARNMPRVTGHAKRRWLNLAGGHGFHGERVFAMQRVGKKALSRELDGRTWDEVPEVRS